MSRSDCDIFVIVRGGWHLTRPCIEAIVRQFRGTSFQLHVVLATEDPFIDAELVHLQRRVGSRVRIHRASPAESLTSMARHCLDEGAAPVAVFVSIDTVLAGGCLYALCEALHAQPQAMFASPLMHGGSVMPFSMRSGVCIERMAEVLRTHGGSDPIYVDRPEPHCFAVRRRMLVEVGYPDLIFDSFSDMLHDWAIRAAKQGFGSVCVPKAYAYRRSGLAPEPDLDGSRRERSGRILESRWGLGKPAAEPSAVTAFRDTIDCLIQAELTPAKSRGPRTLRVDQPLDILCILPTLNPYGGVISVVNLMNEMMLRGHRCSTVSLSKCNDHPHNFYSAPEWVQNWNEIPDRFTRDYDIVLATSWETVPYARAIADRCENAHPMYFIQDLEDQFYDSGDDRRDKVIATYQAIPTRFAKTEYLCSSMAARGWPTHRIRPGMNLDLFYPHGREDSSRATVLGIVRYGHAHRGYDLVLQTLANVHATMPHTRIMVFGTDDLSAANILFPCENLGRIRPVDLPSAYSQADVFLELSRHHGFGRTGLEAMACGAACVLSDSGGLSEYARHGDNAIIVPVEDVKAATDWVQQLLTESALRERLIRSGFQTAARYAERLATDDFLNLVYRTHPRFQAWKEKSEPNVRTPCPVLTSPTPPLY